MVKKREAVGKILMERTVEGMRSVAERYGLLAGSRIDISGSRVRFNHIGLDLGAFLLDDCDLSGSVLTNCIGESASFRGSLLKRVRITSEKGKKVSFRGASFDDAVLEDVTMGPGTLDLSATTYRRAKLKSVTFTMGRLSGADFSESYLEDVLFRSADLSISSFRSAELRRVSFERASLHGADFTGATFEELERWGEPNFDGATISDDLRYQYGIVSDPLKKLTSLIENGAIADDERESLRVFLDRHRNFLSGSEVMLIGSEYYEELEPGLFVKMLKVLKDDLVQ